MPASLRVLVHGSSRPQHHTSYLKNSDIVDLCRVDECTPNTEFWFSSMFEYYLEMCDTQMERFASSA